MGVNSGYILQAISGWDAVELIFKCVFIGLWQVIQLTARRLWKGHRRKLSEDFPPVELTVDSSIGRHCYIKIMGVKYHYVETGPKDGKKVLILGDAPETTDLWAPSWSSVVKKFAELGHHVITLDLRGTGASETGDRRDLSPPKAVKELQALLIALGASENKPAIVIGFGIGGMLTWYLAHCHGSLISKFAVIAAPHPNLFWQHPPATFCNRSLYFIQWPYFPERWLAEGVTQGPGEWASSRARDWSGALNYVRGAAWYKIHSDHKIQARALLIGSRDSASQLVASAQYCSSPALRLLSEPGPGDRDLPPLILDFFIGKQKISEEVPNGILGRVIGAMAGRGRELTARLALPANA
uniref:Epoxide hydrolase 4-like protein n=1 Tax=Heliconius erato TaxID=33431 RepID=L7WWC8_HELEA|nr:epoxide hydrolase 4-like protein [Heliconius erato]